MFYYYTMLCFMVLNGSKLEFLLCFYFSRLSDMLSCHVMLYPTHQVMGSAIVHIE